MPPSTDDADRPEPDDRLADLSDEEQVELLLANGEQGQTDNRLTAEDPPEDEQPPQDPDWVPPAAAEDAPA